MARLAELTIPMAPTGLEVGPARLWKCLSAARLWKCPSAVMAAGRRFLRGGPPPRRSWTRAWGVTISSSISITVSSGSSSTRRVCK